MKTPTFSPLADMGAMPARSRDSQTTSSSSRCWGSIASASRGEIPNSPASKSATSDMNPPRVSLPTPGRVRSQPRSAGTGVIASAPSATSLHRSSAERTPPGNRQPMATIAMGSRAAPSTSRSRLRVS